MKKFWKALGIAALAAVVPVRVQKDEETGKKTFQSLLWKLDVGPTGEGDTTEIGLGLMDGILTTPLMNVITAKKEAKLFTDDPEEAVPFTNSEPDSATVSPVVVEAAAEAVQAAVNDAHAEEAAESDFDPEF